MAGVNVEVLPVEDVPDSLIARFIDRLDRLQFVLLQRQSDDIAALQKKIEVLFNENDTLQHTMWGTLGHAQGP